MGDLESLMSQTKALMGELIAKPKMSDKLLSKPPFRFLHDTISSIISTTGFGEGLYSGGELDSAAITDKEAKVAYLTKIFSMVGICKGYPIDIRALKVVAGLEPENTNIFLIALAECAADRNVDNDQAVRRTLQGEEPGQGPKPTKSGGSSSAAESKFDEPSRHNDDSKSGRDRDSGAKELEAKIPAEMEMIAPERGKSRGGTRGGKPNNAAPDSGLSGGMGGSFAPKLDKEIERCDGSEAATQQLLGDVITRPKLTEKLLSKPPFRFLHDIVMEVIRATGFASGLYAPEESDSANVSEKNQKILFLEKIIKVVGLQLNTLVVANPSKIVAGRDPQDTNNFLQLLAVAVKHLPDSSSAVRTVLEGLDGGGGGGGGEAPAPVQKHQPAYQPEEKESHSPPARQAPAQQQQQREPERETYQQAPSASTKNGNMLQADEKLNLQDNGGDDEGEGDGGDKRSTRPTTARRRPPKVKDGAKELQSKDTAPATKKTEGIIIDGQADDDDIEEDVVDETRLADDLGADAKSSGAGGEPQSKLVKDIMSRQVEQEAPRVSKNEAVEEKGSPDAAAGGSGIRLGRLKKTGTDKKGAAGGAAAFGENDLEKMRSSIQVLVQHTGPLGTCMDYIQEDVSLMTAELHRWEEECRKYEVEYEEAKRKTKETLHPLKLELAEINDYIFEAIAKISSAKATNARNDEKIQQILKLSATA